MINGMVLGIAVGFLAALALHIAWRARLRRRKGSSPTQVRVYSSIEDMRSIGQLSVFKIHTKEIVTATDHSFGEIGRKYLEWMVSSKKMAMIIAFDIDFRYDLESREFTIDEKSSRRYRLTMPRCFYETHIKDIHFYDEQNSKFLPWLLPELVTRAFGSGFKEEDKNRLIEEAKQQASEQSHALVQKMRSEVQAATRRTMVALAKGFGAEAVSVEFRDSDLVELKVEYDSAGSASEGPRERAA